MIPAVSIARACGVAAWSGLLLVSAFADEPCAREAGSTHGVLRAVDGDTLLLDDGQEVRLIGALAPKPDVLSADAANWPPAREAKRALEALVADRTVILRYEGRRRDRYGRVLAQVYVDAGDGSNQVWVQERMVRDGHARAYALAGNAGCIGPLMAAEAPARTAQRGLWSRTSYAVQTSDDIGALLRFRGRFVLVEGRVAEVTRVQRTTYLNFGLDWRTDFTASVANSVVAKSNDGAARVDALAGKRIRVRGWIERRNGPMIALSSLNEIEVLDDVGAASQPSQEMKTPR